jgi:AcrR family transcriptional regulator
MARRMSRSDARRTAIIEAVADHVLANGIANASLRPIARAAGLSDRMLLYYFTDKAEVMAAAIECLSARLTTKLGALTSQPLPPDTLRAHLAAQLFTPEVWPYLCLYLEMAALAARGDAAMLAVGERIGRGFIAWGAAQLDSPTPEARALDAAKVMVAIEGMLMLRSIGLGDVADLAI